MKHREKFDAVSFILGREIRNRTNTHTKLQTVTDIYTPCLSACVDKNVKTCFSHERSERSDYAVAYVHVTRGRCSVFL